MATTTNYGWTTPDDTALVKDGAAAIRSLGTAIDTTVFNNASAAIAKTIVDAKGDIIAATAADTVSRLAVGANDTVLTADSSTATGLKWAAVAGGGYTQLATGSMSGSSVTISSISGSYRNLQLVIQNALPSTQAAICLRFNSDTGSNYFNADTTSSGITATYSATYIQVGNDQHTSGSNLLVIDIPDYANTTTRKLAKTLTIEQNNGTPNFNLGSKRGTWNDTSAISSITILFYSGTISSGTYYLYGVK